MFLLLYTRLLQFNHINKYLFFWGPYFLTRNFFNTNFVLKIKKFVLKKIVLKKIVLKKIVLKMFILRKLRVKKFHIKKIIPFHLELHSSTQVFSYYSIHTLIDTSLIDMFRDFLSNFRKNTTKKHY